MFWKGVRTWTALIGVIAFVGPNKPVVAVSCGAIQEQAKTCGMWVSEGVGIAYLPIHPQCHRAHDDQNFLVVSKRESGFWLGALPEFLSGEHDALISLHRIHGIANRADLVITKIKVGALDGAKDRAGTNLESRSLTGVLEEENNIGRSGFVQIRLLFDNDGDIGPQLPFGGILGKIGLIAGEARIDAQDNYANDSSRKRRLLECIMLFLLGVGCAVFGVCCAFFSSGGICLGP